MQKWEYLVISYAINSAPDHPSLEQGEAYISQINAKTIKWGSAEWKSAPSFYEYLAQLGEEGWELVSTSPWTFKRPKP